MIIVGAKGFAKEVLQIVSVELQLPDDDIVFFDNVSNDLPSKLYNRFQIIKSFDGIKEYLKRANDNFFVLGLGNPKYRKLMYDKFIELSAIPKTLVSKHVDIGSFDVTLGEGTSIMSGSVITNSISIGKGCLINLNCTIGHDCTIGDFVEISPNSNISGRCKIGDNTVIGTSAVLLPDVVLGNNVIVGAGTVVLKSVPDNSTIVGVPGKIIQSKR